MIYVILRYEIYTYSNIFYEKSNVPEFSVWVFQAQLIGLARKLLPLFPVGSESIFERIKERLTSHWCSKVIFIKLAFSTRSKFNR